MTDFKKGDQVQYSDLAFQSLRIQNKHKTRKGEVVGMSREQNLIIIWEGTSRRRTIHSTFIKKYQIWKEQ